MELTKLGQFDTTIIHTAARNGTERNQWKYRIMLNKEKKLTNAQERESASDIRPRFTGRYNVAKRNRAGDSGGKHGEQAVPFAFPVTS